MRPVRIGNCSGFYGDRLNAAREMLDGGPVDVLCGDYLAELTMLILAKAQAKDPDAGYAKTFLTQMRDVLADCVARGVKVVANAGGLNPAGLAAALEELGTGARVAYVEGDDLRGSLDAITPAVAGKPVSANAYLGAWGIAEALGEGADVVVTGRVTDASLVVGPAAWWHGWGREDWDALAGAVVAGHVIECGPQATGGNYSFLDEITDRRYPGFPIAEVAADGSSVITKHPGTGGLVSVGTVTAQLLYEIAAPAYLGPDCTTHFDTVELADDGEHRVRDQRRPRVAAPADAQGRPQRRRRLPQLDDAGPDRARHRGQGGVRRGAAVRGARRAGPVRRGRRPAAALRPPRRADERRGHRPPARHREGPRSAGGRPRVLQRHDGARPRRVRGLPHDDPADRGVGLRRLPPGRGAPGVGHADGRAAGW